MQTHTGSSGQTVSTSPVFVGTYPNYSNGTSSTGTLSANPQASSGPEHHLGRPTSHGRRPRLCWLVLPLALFLAAWALLRRMPIPWRQRP